MFICKNRIKSGLEDLDLVGTPDIILEKISAFSDAGVTHFCALMFDMSSVEENLEQMQWFAEEVIPRV